MKKVHKVHRVNGPCSTFRIGFCYDKMSTSFQCTYRAVLLHSMERSRQTLMPLEPNFNLPTLLNVRYFSLCFSISVSFQWRRNLHELQKSRPDCCTNAEWGGQPVRRKWNLHSKLSESLPSAGARSGQPRFHKLSTFTVFKTSTPCRFLYWTFFMRYLPGLLGIQ